jgi:hypothetical protein
MTMPGFPRNDCPPDDLPEEQESDNNPATLKIKIYEESSDMFVLSTEDFPGALMHEDHICSIVTSSQLDRLINTEELKFRLMEVKE